MPKTSQEIPHDYSDFLVIFAKEGDTFASLSAKYLGDSSCGPKLADYNESDSLRPGQPVLIPRKLNKKGGLDFQGYQTVPVLSYHNFSLIQSDKMTVSQAIFEKQMDLLKERGFHVISINQFFDFLEFKSTIPPKAVVITIDDGWRSAYEIAFPILKKYRYPATLFVYTDNIKDHPNHLSWSLLQEMANQGIDIQSHSKSHINLKTPGKNQSFKDYFSFLEKELSGSKTLIEGKLKGEVKYLSYPYGDTNQLVIELAKKLGYRGALTIKRGSNPFFVNNYRVNRSVIYGDYDLTQFEKNLITFREERLQ